MKSSDIILICKDVGGANTITPVARMLREKKHDVLVVADSAGQGKFTLKSAGIDFEEHADIEKLERLQPKLCVTVLDATGGIGKEIIPFYKEQGIETIGLKDNWFTGIGNIFFEKQYHPDYMITGDAIGAELILQTWPDYTSEQIELCGFPHLDSYCNISFEKIRKQTREKLQVPKNKKLVLFSGQIQNVTRILQDVITVLNRYLQNVVLLAAQHPRMSEEAPDQMHPWQDALKTFNGQLVNRGDITNFTHLIGAADLVISEYSTALVEAAALGLSAISYMDEQSYKKFHDEIGMKIEYPLITGGHCAHAYNLETLKQYTRQALAGNLKLKKLPLDGRNTERVVDVITSLL